MILGLKNDGDLRCQVNNSRGRGAANVNPESRGGSDPAFPDAHACRMFIRNRLRVPAFPKWSPPTIAPNPYMRVPEIPPVLPHTQAGFRLVKDTLLRAAPFRASR